MDIIQGVQDLRRDVIVSFLDFIFVFGFVVLCILYLELKKLVSRKC